MESIAQSTLKVGDRITVEIGPVAHGGHFIARHLGQVIFVRYGITGEEAVVEITSVSSKLARADVVEVIKASKDRVVPPCKYAVPGGCGGCDFQHIDIAAQSELKRSVIREQFSRLGKIEIDLDMQKLEPASGLNWRSRMDFAISKGGKPGLYSARSKEVIEIDRCLIAVEAINDPAMFARNWKGEDRLEVAVSNSGEKNVSRGGRSISGPTQLHEVVGEHTFEISPASFWQSHIAAPSTLTKLALDLMALRPGDQVCDLYGGVGLFTAPIAEDVGDIGKVHLIESSHRATQDALKIFEKQKNVVIHSGRVEQKLPLINRVDVILLDPPRTGAGEMVVKQMLAKKPRTIVYISCDPASLARDARALEDGGYHIDYLVGFDLFPMTHHVECVARFTLG
ncbi:MAG: class I SAM-dependent RNA methyltransferase [SAR202 cluster bacterium]|jgi:tRNA/tmRNA/rRNA uracil-C5-methylase (TrmA/RlmC/RlmD family)|nr:class I SAM-dependent RNA methyltransferase [SAR202 cluster bacterium]|tara:strand:- start:15860 stop:17050 length:1191 start_codon:yes stop_codon:yes gene_type:complete